MIEIYSKKNCSYCAQTRNFLKDGAIPFREYKLDEDFTKEILKEKYPSASTYPVIIVDGFYIGGFVQLKEQFNQGGTQKFLTEG